MGKHRAYFFFFFVFSGGGGFLKGMGLYFALIFFLAFFSLKRGKGGTSFFVKGKKPKWKGQFIFLFFSNFKKGKKIKKFFFSFFFCFFSGKKKAFFFSLFFFFGLGFKRFFFRIFIKKVFFPKKVI